MFTPSSDPARPSWRNSPIVRFFGSVLSWFLFSLSFVLLVEAVIGVASVGGTCASGNTPYVIAHQCPDVAIWAAPSVFGGLIAVGLGVWLTQGFGPSLSNLAWPILFGGLGGLFLVEGVSSADPVGYILGGIFIIMGLVPLVLSLRASAQRVVLGAINLRGDRFTEGEHAKPTPFNVNYASSDATVSPTAINWLVSMAILFGASYLGYWVAVRLAGG